MTFIWHCQESNSQPVPSQVCANFTRPQWRTFLYLAPVVTFQSWLFWSSGKFSDWLAPVLFRWTDNLNIISFVLFPAMRIEMEESIIVGNDLKITSSKKKKIYKLDSLKPKDVREASVFLENGVDCECSILENSGEKRVKPSLIVMGVKRNNRLIVTSMLAFNRNAKELGKAMKDIKKKNVCRSTQGDKKGSALPGGKAKAGGKKKSTQTTPAALTTVLPTSGKRSKNGGGESVTRPTRRTAKTRPAF